MCLHQRFKHALKAFFECPNHEQDQKINVIQRLVQMEDISTLYQPIVELKTGNFFGFEALSRPQKDMTFLNASELFSFAEQHGIIYDLDLKCRELAIKRIVDRIRDRMLFLNVNSNVLLSAFQKDDSFKRFVKSVNMNRSNVVLEITERQAIKDFEMFNIVLEEYRKEGFKIAVDDLGAGYSSLQTIAELKPDYIKLDMSLVRDIHNVEFKRILVETLVGFSDKSKSLLIAEGIEKKEEFEMLVDLGVHFGQGYFIEKPKVPQDMAC